MNGGNSEGKGYFGRLDVDGTKQMNINPLKPKSKFLFD
jgi:hypothetical protein